MDEWKYLEECDVLTGIYDETRFFEAPYTVLEMNCDKKFVFLRLDVYEAVKAKGEDCERKRVVRF